MKKRARQKMKIASKDNAERGMELSLLLTSCPRCLNPTPTTHPIPKIPKVLPNLTTTTTIQTLIPSMGRRQSYSRIYLSLPTRTHLHLLDPIPLIQTRRPQRDQLVPMVVTLFVVGTLLTITICLPLISMRRSPCSQTPPIQIRHPHNRGLRLDCPSALLSQRVGPP